MPEQFPIKPEPERPVSGSLPPAPAPGSVKSKMLSLENLREALPDLAKVDVDDDEVTKITGGNEPDTSLATRHITPQICLDSGATSRTVSRISSSSQV